MSSWRELIGEELARTGETWSDVETVVFSARRWTWGTPADDPDPGDWQACLDQPFDAGYGLPRGLPFTMWTRRRVYFPVEYDGSESCASVPRHPCPEAVDHISGR